MPVYISCPNYYFGILTLFHEAADGGRVLDAEKSTCVSCTWEHSCCLSTLLNPIADWLLNRWTNGLCSYSELIPRISRTEQTSSWKGFSQHAQWARQYLSLMHSMRHNSLATAQISERASSANLHSAMLLLLPWSISVRRQIPLLSNLRNPTNATKIAEPCAVPRDGFGMARRDQSCQRTGETAAGLEDGVPRDGLAVARRD